MFVRVAPVTKGFQIPDPGLPPAPTIDSMMDLKRTAFPATFASEGSAFDDAQA
jgi:hypothetical protein